MKQPHKLLQHKQISQRIGSAILVPSFIVLFITFTVTVALQWQSYRSNLIDHLYVVSDLISRNSTAAINFDDPDTAKLLLGSLQGEPGIVYAAIYLHNNTSFSNYHSAFATYTKPEYINSVDTQPLLEWHKQHSTGDGADSLFRDEQLYFYFPISFEKEQIGSIILLADSSPLWNNLQRYLQILLSLFLGLSIFTVLLSRYLKRTIAKPIELLAEGMQRVSTEKDYEFRLAAVGNDEITQLTNGFNQMLAQLQQRDQQIAQNQEQLEQTVAQRTEELSHAVRDAQHNQQIAEDASRAKSEFLATMSHEIRTPMNGVIGMTELLQETELSPRQEEFCHTIQSSANSLMIIINDILDFSKMEAGHLQLSEQPFHLVEMVEDCAEIFAESAHRRGIEFALDLNDNLPQMVFGDGYRLRQVLVNLLGNAFKFTKQGEVVISISAEIIDEAQIQLQVSVRDTGIGISQDKQNSIFEAFSQADSGTTRQYGGTGLGLAICQHIIQLMHGEIGVNSSLGNGSEFWFNVLVQPCSTEIEADEPLLPSGLEGKRVLVVDDNQTNREILLHRLQLWGMDVSCCASAEMAITELRSAQAEQQPFAIMLVDWHMPGIDGLMLVKMINTSPELHTPYYIMLSSGGSDQMAQQAKDAGIGCYLSKPVRQRTLKHCLYDAINGKSQTILPFTEKESGEQRQINARILLAEDNLVNQAMQQQMFELFGCSVTLAENGQQAVELATDGSFDLIFMDCHMPVMDGFLAATTLRDKGIELPIIAMTADVQKGIQQRCFDAGMSDYLSKPFRKMQLLTMLQKWLPDIVPQTKSTTPQTNTTTAKVEEQDKLLDEAVLAQIREMQRPGQADILHHFVSLYLQHSPGLLAAIEKAISSGNAEELRQAAHSLKSSSANVGASKLAAQCAKLEQQGSAGVATVDNSQLQQLRDCFSRTIAKVVQNLTNT